MRKGTLFVGGAAILALLAGMPAASLAQVVINEIDYDQAGTDGAEFVELLNTGLVAENLDLYTLDLINGNGATAYQSFDLPNVNLAPGGYFVVCGNAANVAVCDLDVSPDTNLVQNGAPDAVALLLSGVLVDAVSYEGDTAAPFTEGSGVGLVDNSAEALAGISRFPDGADTNQNNVDLSFRCITPGAANSAQNTDCMVAGDPELVINEIDYDQPGSDTAEFIEITNVGTAPAMLDAFELQLVNGTGGGAAVYQTVVLPAVELGPGEYFVACADAATVLNCDLAVLNSIQNGAPDAVAVLTAGTVVDTVSYEGDTGAPFTEGSGSGLQDPGTTGNDNLGISRFPDGGDTDQNNVDLSTRCITPGFPNSAETGDCGVPSEPMLVVNEIDYDQPGGDSAEFVEIKNVGTSSVDLSAFSLELINGTGGGASAYQTVALPAVSLAADGYYVVCSDAATVGGCDLAVLNSIQNGAPDAVAITQGGAIIDTVSYEGDTGAPFTEGSGSGLQDPGTTGNDNLGISRFPDGGDTDQNNVDLSTRCITPGAANSVDATDCPSAAPANLVINEIDYDQPGADTAEFVEIKNSGLGAADLSAFSLELVNGTGGGATVYQTVALPAVSLAGGDFFVVCTDVATVAGCDLAALNSIQNGAPDAVALTSGGVLVDTVSYEGDTGAPFTEGSGVGLADSGSTGEDFKGISRFPDGTDTDQNNVDLIFACITPGLPNTSSATACSATGPTVEVWEIQGNGLASPLENQFVTTVDNVVTAVGLDGFFIQTPAARTDGDPETSDGIFVFTAGAPAVAVGDQVDVSGQVQEFFSLTEIGLASVTFDSAGNPLPTPVVFDATTPSPNQPQPATELERFEGMIVTFDGIATGPTDQFGDTAVVANTVRAFREPGIDFPGLPGLPVWDGNPEIFEIDADGLGGVDEQIFAGQAVSATGPLTFSFGDYQVLPSSLAVGPAPALPRAVRARMAGEVTIATQNVLRLFDDQDDPAINEPVPTPADFQAILAKFSSHIRDILGSPDVIAFQEVENLNTLQELATRIQADDPALVYSAHLVEGNDVGGIDVGYLTRDDTIVVNSVTQFGANLLLSVDGSLLHDRPPLVLDATTASGLPLTVIVVHQRSLGGIEGSQATRVKIKRLEQAESVAGLVQDLQTTDPAINLVVTGDFNAFQFTDGFVDVLGIITGNLDPAGAEFPGTDLVNPDLVNEILSLPAEERYSFVFGGSAQVLDHMLTSSALVPLVTGVEFARGNADAPIGFGMDPGTPLRASDHDGLVLFIDAVQDEDGDTIPDDADFCPGTVIPESVPRIRLLPFRWALVDEDPIFDTRSFHGRFPSFGFTLEDTGGCSCEQIIDELDLFFINELFGCNSFSMYRWTHIVESSSP